MKRSFAALLAVGVLVGAAGEARAGHHLMKVVEVFPGTTAAPSAQYVVLQMYAGGQNFVSGSAIVIYGATNSELGRFTFTASVASGANQAKILIATTDAQTSFGVTPDKTMTAIIPAAGGKVCFESSAFGVIDCFAWGNHPGSASGGASTNVGAPFSPVLGLPPGRAAARRLDLTGSATVLDLGDDTNDSANDWGAATPAPKNNAGQTGAAPAATCGDGTIGGLESCDDSNATGGDGCSATCADEACGDLVVNDVNETCDDGNAVSGDGCDVTCRTTGCGSGVLTAGELCDDGNLVSGDGCDATCRPTGCGSGVVTAGEQCDDGDLISGDGCDANCTTTGCGNGIVTNGEDCEPPGVGGCDASCQLACTVPADCADTDPCTTNERCLVTGCAVDPTPIDDAVPCTVDSCGPGGVVHTPLPDGMDCTTTGPRSVCVATVCVEARCGDGYVDPAAPGGAEECDDGNLIDTDACTTACLNARCGDGFVQTGEACDDGNAIDTDACTGTCEAARCGDGFTGPGETCDDGNGVDGDGCTRTCVTERCGDGLEQLGEQCDDGNTAAGDGCSATCQDETAPPADDGGCCSTGGGGPAPLLLGLGVALLLARRRRAGVGAARA